MSDVTVVIPARNEIYLQKTIDDIFNKARADTEVVAVLDGYWPNPPLKDNPKVRLIHRGVSQGLRDGINSAVAISDSKYVLKCDAHCMFDEGFDTKLVSDCDRNWIVVPRRKRLDAERWCIQDVGKPDVDYMYLSYPHTLDRNGKQIGLHGVNWDELNKREDLKNKAVDDLMSAQGSCWFMHKDYYNELELLDEEHYGAFWSEFQEIGLKCWLSGGRVVVNKNTWYAHLHKRNRGYTLIDTSEDTQQYVMKWMNMGEAWSKQTLPLDYLIHKFSPVPGWPNELP
jgi:glycosyltransferase involved in cell wall biosynthesis